MMKGGDTVGIVVAFLIASCLLVDHGCVLMQKDRKKPMRIMLVQSSQENPPNDSKSNDT